MEPKQRKSFSQYVRILHRDLGFIAIGLTIVYALSGIVLIYRNIDLLVFPKTIEQQLAPNLSADKLGEELHQRNFKVTKTEGDTIFFKNGSYSSTTGEVIYIENSLIFPLNKFSELHKTNARGNVHWVTTIYGVILLFLAISSFWMFNPKSKLFKRGIYLSIGGILLTIILLML